MGPPETVSGSQAWLGLGFGLMVMVRVRVRVRVRVGKQCMHGMRTVYARLCTVYAWCMYAWYIGI